MLIESKTVRSFDRRIVRCLIEMRTVRSVLGEL